jgi:hypothetical protein
MDYEAREICDIMERLLERDDANTAWYLQDAFSRIYNKQAPDSEERVLMADIWKRMMLKWH